MGGDESPPEERAGKDTEDERSEVAEDAVEDAGQYPLGEAAEYQAQIDQQIAAEDEDKTFTDVDPAARFKEVLEERYANEIRTERADEAGRTQDIASSVGNLMRHMIGGPPSYNL